MVFTWFLLSNLSSEQRYIFAYFRYPSFARREELYNSNAGKIILPLPPLPLLLGPIYEFISKGGSLFSRVIYLEYIPLQGIVAIRGKKRSPFFRHTHRIIHTSYHRALCTYLHPGIGYASHMYDTSCLQHAQHEKKPGTPGTGNSPHMYDTYFRIYAA